MIRRTTLLSLALLVAIGAGLFQLKHEVQILEGRLTDINRAILDDQESIHVLDAEWTYLDRPWRIAALAKRHLELAPLAAAQVVTFDQIPTRAEPVISDATNPTAASGANQRQEAAARSGPSFPNMAFPKPLPKPSLRRVPEAPDLPHHNYTPDHGVKPFNSYPPSVAEVMP